VIDKPKPPQNTKDKDTSFVWWAIPALVAMAAAALLAEWLKQ
jgi:hypothetical protein